MYRVSSFTEGKINYEILLVDDFSTDGSKILCKRIIKNKKNCKLLNLKLSPLDQVIQEILV